MSAVFGTPLARLFVARIIDSEITPIDLTMLSFLAGVITCGLIVMDLPGWVRVLPFAFYHAKNILDSADGALARARGRMDRLGRFMDSVVDFSVSAMVFGAMATVAAREMSPLLVLPAALFAFLASVLSTSYYVFYAVRFTEEMSLPTASRTDESPELSDTVAYADPATQRAYEMVYALFRLFYLWQDRLVARVDRRVFYAAARARIGRGFSSNRAVFAYAYYTDRRLMTFVSFVGLGCHVALGSVAILYDAYVPYFLFTIAYSLLVTAAASLLRFQIYARKETLIPPNNVNRHRY